MASGGAEAAGDMVVVVAAGEESVVLRLLVDDPLDAAEVVDAAGDGDGALLREPVLRRRLEQRHEQRVLQVPHRNNEPLLLLPAAGRLHHPYRHAPLGRHPAAAARASSSHRRRRLLFLQKKVHTHLLPRTARLQQGLASSEDVCYNDAAWTKKERRLQLHDEDQEGETVAAVGVYRGRGGGGAGE
jgi:hypothetical protein